MTNRPTMDSPARFSRGQIGLHWLTLLLVATAYAAIEAKGLVPKGTPAHDLLKLVHFNAGALVGAVMLLRLGLRWRRTDPAIVPPPPRWQAAAARIAHRLLYATFLALPVLGVLALAFGGKQWALLGLPVHDLVAPDKALGHALKEIHETWARAGYFIVGLHAAAALFHHYLRHDSALAGMLPRT